VKRHQKSRNGATLPISRPLPAYADPENLWFHAVSNGFSISLQILWFLANPLLVHVMGSKKMEIKGETAANQIWWLCQPLYWFTVPANCHAKSLWLSNSTSSLMM
jgi:hypothetical protein